MGVPAQVLAAMRGLYVEHHEQLRAERRESAALPAAVGLAAGSNAEAQAEAQDPAFVEALTAVKSKEVAQFSLNSLQSMQSLAVAFA